MTRLLLCVLLIGLTSCSAKPLNPEQARTNLRREAEEVCGAILREDHRRMADLTHPAVVNGFGGKAKFEKRMGEIAADMKSQGFGIKDVTLSEPSELVEAS